MRIVAIADMHGKLDFTVPPCDLLIVAGDLLPDFAQYGRGSADAVQRQRAWFRQTFRAWRERQPAEACLATWGNHDWLGQHFDHDGAENPGDPHMVVDALVTYPTVHGAVNIWFSPWSNEFCGWAFMKEPEDLKAHYDAIPEGTDIIVSHAPPYGYGDITPYPNENKGDLHCGSKELLAAIERVKPPIVINGHIHGCYGARFIDVCDQHGTQARDCECKTFHQVAVYNVSVVNEQYQRVNAPTVIEL